jgi:hypothetical protein
VVVAGIVVVGVVLALAGLPAALACAGTITASVSAVPIPRERARRQDT